MNGSREVNVRRGTGSLPDIRSSMDSVFRFEDIGESRWLVHTDMYFDDGDEFHIVLRMTDGGYTLTDEGHTVMWLSHDGRDVPGDDRVVGQYGVSFDDGRLGIAVTSVREVGPALMSLCISSYHASGTPQASVVFRTVSPSQSVDEGGSSVEGLSSPV